jgi:hypothetical protein
MSKKVIIFAVVVVISVMLFFRSLWRWHFADCAFPEQLDEEIHRLKHGNQSILPSISEAERGERREQIKKSSFAAIVFSYLLILIGSLPFFF